jgi:hypothetical protein
MVPDRSGIFNGKKFRQRIKEYNAEIAKNAKEIFDY